jgi:hypothetical protein
VVIKGWDKLVNGDLIKITIWNDNALDSSTASGWTNNGWSSDTRNIAGEYNSYPYSARTLNILFYVKILANYDAYYHSNS